MSQLTFDGALDNGSNPKELAEESVEGAKNSWYKGRVLSHSSISLYRTCPQRWKFRYLDKVPEKPRSFFSFGKSVHSGLEFLFTKVPNGFPSLDDLLANFKGGWIREGYESPQQEKWFYQEGERILRGFYAKHRDDLINVFQVEFKFTIDIEGVPVTGFMDRIDTTPSGNLAILDYKTGKAFDKVRVRQEPQLTLYQMAAKKLFGKEVETVGLYHLNTLNAFVVPAHTPSQEEAVVTNVMEAAKGINENKFDPKPEGSGYCQWCDYLQICPAFSSRKPSRIFNSGMADSISELVDRLGRIDEKIQELAKQRDAVQKTLLTNVDEKKPSQMEGKYFSANFLQEKKENSILETKPKEPIH